MYKPPKVNVIFDDRRYEKYDPLIAELKRQKIKSYEIWPCIMRSNIVSSINASHKMIVAQAKQQGLKECCIAEDDVMFPHEKGWEWFLENRPDGYDIYSGGNYMSFERPQKTGAFRVKCIVGFHLYMVHESYYDKFLATPDEQHIDTEQKSENMFCVYPFAAIQRPGFSANNKTICNYNSILNDCDVYGGLPK